MTLPIINQPQVAILSTDGVKRRPVVVTGPDGEEAIAIHSRRQPHPHLGPPRLRRRLRRQLPQPDPRDPRDEGLGRRAVTLRVSVPRAAATGRPAGVGRQDAARPVARARCVPRRPRAAARRCTNGRATTTCCCSEHPHVFTLGVRADLRHLLVAPADVGAELVKADRGGDVTYHGPGQLVGYPILSLPTIAGLADVPAPTCTPSRQVLIGALADLGLPGAGRLDDFPGVWIDDRKIAAIGVRNIRGRTMHGFALNVDPDMAYFGHIVPCGIADRAVTSLGAEGIDASMRRGRRRRRRPVRRLVAAGGGRPGRRRLAPRRRRLRPLGLQPRRRRRRAGAARRAPGRGGRHRRARRSSDASRRGQWPGCATTTASCGSSARCATSTSSPCARRPAAPTSPSAGPRAPPPS